MRKAVALAAGLIILLLVNQGIYQRERLLTDGRIVFLELSPVDPRSLMQGDYMRLRFAAADQAFSPGQTQLADGHLVVAVDRRGVGQFRRFADTGRLGSDEVALQYRVRGGQANFATNAFFFEEGQAKAFENARFGEFRVAPDGAMILTGLRGSRLEPLRGAAK
ncbi:GDYXXLXY domain-containing protein [Sphingomonas sp. 37zxx]|uniref:GDYXXLXY domain-containing protein n=1 Tax=Sphingomonas sp. 37zxx TaxID=1550073 RepID=UPI00053BE8EE|nr:GDYXXLXY domain-containing protein [Sphingomonas sp. 37zxx]